MKIVKDNVVKDVSEKAGKIAINLMGWSELVEAKRPEEIGKRTKPIIIVRDNAIPLKETKPEPIAGYPGETKGEFEKLPPADDTEKVSEPKKTRKSPVKSKSKK